MQRTFLLLFATALFFSSTVAFSQKNELSFSAGGIFTSDQRTAVVFPCPPGGPACFNEFAGLFQTDPGVALEATYARRITRFGPASLYFELPVIGVPGRDVQSSIMIAGLGGTGTSPGSSASAVFFTPSAKVKFLESAPIAPFVTVGGGFAHSNANFNVLGNLPRGASSTSGALQFGGGADLNSPIPHLVFRAEARDFYCQSGIQPLRVLPAHISPVHLHHVFVGGGMVLKF